MRRKCSKCKKVQGLSQFSKNATNPSGYDHYCKSCNKKRMKKYFRSSRGKAVMRKATIKRTKLRRLRASGR